MTTHEAHSRPSFRERVQALAGHGTWREPSGGSASFGQLPSDHMVCAALSFGRTGPKDIGPDIAADMATGRPANYQRVCEWTGRQIGNDRSAAARRCNGYAAHVAVAAYNATVRGWAVPDAPTGVSVKDWGDLVLFACLLLDYAAEDALALAARKHRRVA